MLVSTGYCYGGNEGHSGYRQERVFTCTYDAQKFIEARLAGRKVEFRESSGKFRAYADETPTGYIYFQVKAETWTALNLRRLGEKGVKSVVFTGSLEDVKVKVRNLLEKEAKKNGEAKIKTLSFERTGDNVTVNAVTNTIDGEWDTEILLVKVA